VHKDFRLFGCSYTDKEVLFGLNGEEIYYADFVKGVAVDALPDFVEHPSFPGLYEFALTNIQVCKTNLDVAIKAYKNPQEKMGWYAFELPLFNYIRLYLRLCHCNNVLKLTGKTV